MLKFGNSQSHCLVIRERQFNTQWLWVESVKEELSEIGWNSRLCSHWLDVVEYVSDGPSRRLCTQLPDVVEQESINSATISFFLLSLLHVLLTFTTGSVYYMYVYNYLNFNCSKYIKMHTTQIAKNCQTKKINMKNIEMYKPLPVVKVNNTSFA
jgi:hypothetical protein